MAVILQLRRGTASEWSTANPILAQGELGLETDTGKFKVGNGTSGWNSLSYAVGASGFSGYSGYSGAAGSAGAAGSSGFSGYSGYSGAAGSAGSAGASGFSGYSGYSGRSGYSGYSGYKGLGANVSIWNFSDLLVAIPSSDNPGTGSFALNSGAFSSTTILTINRTDNLSRNVSGWLANWGASTNAVEGHLNFVNRNAITAFANFNVTAVSGYANHIAVWVTHLASGGTHNYFDDYEVGFVRAGDVGTSGFSGYSGSGGASEAVVSAAAKIYAYRGFR